MQAVTQQAKSSHQAYHRDHSAHIAVQQVWMAVATVVLAKSGAGEVFDPDGTFQAAQKLRCATSQPAEHVQPLMKCCCC